MKTRKDIAREECTRDPIFLFQVRQTARQAWRTETVFLTREEGEKWGKIHSYRWKHWQVYCIPATGELATLIASAPTVPPPPPGAP
jgi:hypothetical protein